MKYYNFDRVASTYDSTRSVPNELSIRFREEIMIFLEENFEERTYRILSLGLGSGRIESQLTKKRVQLFGVDISKLMIREFKKKMEAYPSYVSVADVCSLPFRKDFHLTIAIHLVHLINRFQELVDEIKRVSKVFVAGGVYTNLYSHPIYEAYQTCLQSLGWVQQTRGLSVIEFVEKFQTEGYKIEKKRVVLPSCQISSEVYTSIKNRCPSSLWNVSDSIHNKAIAMLDKKINTNEITFEENFSTFSYMNLYFILLE